MPCQFALEVNLINFPTTFINVMINGSKLSRTDVVIKRLIKEELLLCGGRIST